MIKLLLSLLLVSLNIYAIEFIVPIDNPQYTFLDSLYTQINLQESSLNSLEHSIIKDTSILNSSLNTKISYANYLHKYNLINKSKLLSYKSAYFNLTNTKILYFQTLLTILTDDNKIQCFLLYKKYRDQLSLLYGFID